MALARCPWCDVLRFIVPRDKIDPHFSAHWWELEVHKDPDKPELCKGSGKRV